VAFSAVTGLTQLLLQTETGFGWLWLVCCSRGLLGASDRSRCAPKPTDTGSSAPQSRAAEGEHPAQSRQDGSAAAWPCAGQHGATSGSVTTAASSQITSTTPKPSTKGHHPASSGGRQSCRSAMDLFCAGFAHSQKWFFFLAFAVSIPPRSSSAALCTRSNSLPISSGAEQHSQHNTSSGGREAGAADNSASQGHLEKGG